MDRRGALRLGSLAALLLLAACGSEERPGRLLVTSGFTDQVFLLDAGTGAVLDSVSLDRRPGERDEPHGVAAATDGRHWYVTLSHGEPTLWKFESEGSRLVGRLTLPLSGASRVRLSPDGTLAAVPDYWRAGHGEPGRVAVVRTDDLTVVGTVEVCRAPHDAVFSPSGDRIAVTCSQGTGVAIVDASSLEVVARHDLSADGEDREESGGAPRPMNAAWSPDGRRLLVSLMGRGSIADLDPATGAWNAIAVGAAPAQLEIDAEGGWAVAANRGGRSISLVPLAGGDPRVVAIPGAHPHGVAFGADPSVAYVTYEGDVDTTGGVAAVDLTSGSVLWHVPLGVFTLGVAFLRG